MQASKKLTSKSGLTIPKDIRAASGFFPGMAVDIETVKDGILIKPHVPVCLFCGNPEEVAKIKGLDICSVCWKSISEEVNAREKRC